MTDLKRSVQRGQGNTAHTTGDSRERQPEENRGAEFGTAERGTRGTNRDADASGESMNQGHGHPQDKQS